MVVTLRQVAERAGVSRSAVSRSFTPGASVAADTRARVLRAAKELGYIPNLLARSLTTRSTGLIGLVSNNFHNPAFLQIFDLFTRGLQEAGLRPLLVNLTDETDPDRSVSLLRQYSVDGVILASSTLPGSFAGAFRAAGLPTVHAFGGVGQGSPVDVVGIDNVAAGRMAAEALIARGYRRLGFLGGPEAASTTQDRLAGFRAGAQAQPGVTLRTTFAREYSYDAGHRAMLADPAPHAEAYFCGDDVLTMGAMAALAEAGLSVPRDVGLIGLNDMEMAGWAGFRLTTIRQPFDAIVAAVLDRLTALLADPGLPPEVRLLPCTLMVRDSLRQP